MVFHNIIAVIDQASHCFTEPAGELDRDGVSDLAVNLKWRPFEFEPIGESL